MERGGWTCHCFRTSDFPFSRERFSVGFSRHFYPWRETNRLYKSGTETGSPQSPSDGLNWLPVCGTYTFSNTLSLRAEGRFRRHLPSDMRQVGRAARSTGGRDWRAGRCVYPRARNVHETRAPLGRAPSECRGVGAGRGGRRRRPTGVHGALNRLPCTPKIRFFDARCPRTPSRTLRCPRSAPK